MAQKGSLFNSHRRRDPRAVRLATTSGAGRQARSRGTFSRPLSAASSARGTISVSCATSPRGGGVALQASS
eukprot:6322523-Pyramimonas_sp.AAC.1